MASKIKINNKICTLFTRNLLCLIVTVCYIGSNVMGKTLPYLNLFEVDK